MITTPEDAELKLTRPSSSLSTLLLKGSGQDYHKYICVYMCVYEYIYIYIYTHTYIHLIYTLVMMIMTIMIIVP